MKELNAEEVRKIAELSLLELSEQETEEMVHELNRILQAFQALDNCPIPVELGHDRRSGLVLDSVAAQSEASSRMRPDQVNTTLSPAARQSLLAVFPNESQGFLRVPKVLGK